jgi:protocatechuate 3,4-dioxygenase beta subunit
MIRDARRGQKVNRRDVVGLLGVVGLALLAGCGSEEDAENAGASGSGGSGQAGEGGSAGQAGSGQAGEGGSAGQAGDGGSAGAGQAGSGGTGGSSAASGEWTTGGTAAMKDAASYPDPFASGAASCALTCTLTKGPCWAPTAPVRQDVSEGEAGVPMRLALRVVEADGCTPVAGAEVEIWHCNIDGIYSAKDVENPAFCTGNNAKALASYYFRGRAITDSDGKLIFDTCYPGWYPSRAVHIHFAVRRAAHAGENTTTNARVISQLFFPEDLTKEIFSTVEGYKQKGQPDTTFASDTVIGSVSDKTPYIVDYQRMTDGAMLAWKTIAISDTASCGSSGGGGPGGPPPGGG